MIELNMDSLGCTVAGFHDPGSHTIMKSALKKAKGNGSEGKAYVATSTRQESGAPKIFDTARFSRRIVHRELVGSVSGSILLTATGYPLNPGMSQTFPWLSSQADGWEQYRFHRLTFSYVTRTATSTVGSVILVPDYDPTDAAPATEAVATSKMGAVEDATWRNIDCKIDPAAMFPMGPRKFIRSSRHSGDLRTYDAGNFFLCTVGEIGTDAIGKLWVEYDVELFVPQTESDGVHGTETSFYCENKAQTYATGVAAVFAEVNEIYDGLKLGTVAAGVWTPPAGAYNVTAYFKIKDTAAEACTANIVLRVAGTGGYVGASSTMTYAANDAVQTVVTGYFEADGTQAVDFLVTLTGAAGVLTVETCRILFTAA